MTRKKVSVVMSTYNHAHYVEQAIESVLRQRDVDIEMLIGDDGSTDGTPSVIARIQDPRIHFTGRMGNRGAALALSELVAKASGHYVAVLNSDDYWRDAEKLRKQLDVMEARPQLGACFTSAVFVDRDGHELDKSTLVFGHIFDQENRTQGRWLRRFFTEGNCLCHPSVLVRRECYENLGLYRNHLRQLPDYDMWIRLVKHYPIHVLPEESVAFRILPSENASSQSAPNRARIANETYLITSGFFDGVTEAIFRDGFEDLLLRPDIRGPVHCDIEQAMLFLGDAQKYEPAAYQLIGIGLLARLLESAEHKPILARDYGVDDKWFHQRLASFVDLRPELQAAQLVDRYEAELRKAAKELDRRADGLAAYERELDTVRQEIRAMRASTSWRLTAPFRRFVDLFKGGRGLR